jgi:beta-mannanase
MSSWWSAAAFPAVLAAALAVAAGSATASSEPRSSVQSRPAEAVSSSVASSRAASSSVASSSVASSRAASSRAAANGGRASRRWLNGVALPSVGKDLPVWQRKTAEQPSIISFYINLAAPFPLRQLKTIIAAGALPLIQIDPKGDSLAALSAGRYNKQLIADRRGIASLHHRVAVSFAHEMNGVWTGWGCDHVTPSTFRSAWRHVHRIIGAQDVTWVWEPGQSGRCAITSWYPGSRYVSWIGIDGYLRTPRAAFGREFNATIKTARHLGPGKPIVLAEAACNVSASMVTELRELYSGARRAGMIGLVWFDGKTALGNYHPWASEAFLRAFKRIVR